MTVYLVSLDVPYEPGGFIGVAATEAAAVRLAEAWAADRGHTLAGWSRPAWFEPTDPPDAIYLTAPVESTYLHGDGRNLVVVSGPHEVKE